MYTNKATVLLQDRVGNHTRLLKLNRPEKLNALSRVLLNEISSVLREFEDDPSVRCVIITGNGKAFSAGADIKEFIVNDVESYGDLERVAALDVISSFKKPLIAAVNGYALGGGCELAMACDIIIAAKSALFGQPEVKLASLPGDGGTQRLPRCVGKSMAMQMILTGDSISAEKAERCGLISEVVDDFFLIERAVEIASSIEKVSPSAIMLAKMAVKAAFEMPLAEGLILEHRFALSSFYTPDRIEGLAAFREKRTPNFI